MKGAEHRGMWRSAAIAHQKETRQNSKFGRVCIWEALFTN